MTNGSGSQMMDHRKIEAENIPERYIRGKLNAEEAEAFEQHLLRCSRCLGQVHSAERMLHGLRQLATDDDSWSGHLPGLTVPAEPEPKPRRVLWPIAVILALLAFIPPIFKLANIERLRHDLASVHAETRTIHAEKKSQARLLQELQRVQGEREQAAVSLEEELQLRQLERQKVQDLIASADHPQVNIPILTLGPSSEIPEIERSPKAGWVVLSIEPDNAQLGTETFHATLIGPSDRGGESDQTLWTLFDLRPDYRGLIHLSVHSSALSAGSYRLRIETADKARRFERQFRVLGS